MASVTPIGSRALRGIVRDRRSNPDECISGRSSQAGPVVVDTVLHAVQRVVGDGRRNRVVKLDADLTGITDAVNVVAVDHQPGHGIERTAVYADRENAASEPGTTDVIVADLDVGGCGVAEAGVDDSG